MHGAVLAGGSSRRMGSDKADLRLSGQPLWQRQVCVLRGAGAERVVLVRGAGQREPEGVAVQRDRLAGCGPIAGLQTALCFATAPWVAVLAVDMPGIDAAWFRWLLGFCRPGVGAMARHAEACEPLAAIYPAQAVTEVTRRLQARDLSLQRLALSLAAAGRMTLLPLPAGAVARAVSVNTVEQLSRFDCGEPAGL